jgi:hypothetical protein
MHFSILFISSLATLATALPSSPNPEVQLRRQVQLPPLTTGIGWVVGDNYQKCGDVDVTGGCINLKNNCNGRTTAYFKGYRCRFYR